MKLLFAGREWLGREYAGAEFRGVATTAPPVAAFTGSPLSGVAPLTVTFTDQSSNAPTSWSWTQDSGSGPTVFSTAQNPTQTFSVGTWSIGLTATNAGGSGSLTKTGYITVTIPPNVRKLVLIGVAPTLTLIGSPGELILIGNPGELILIGQG